MCLLSFCHLKTVHEDYSKQTIRGNNLLLNIKMKEK